MRRPLTPSLTARRGYIAALALALITALLAAAVPVDRAEGVVAAETTCKDVFFLGARGSGQDSGDGHGFGPEVDRFRGKLKFALTESPAHTVQRAFIDYPAESTDTLRPSKKDLAFVATAPDPEIFWDHYRKSHLGKYDDSIKKGVDRAEKTIITQAAKCPDQLFVLAGYSQGAMVMHRVLNRFKRDNRIDLLERVAGVLLIADGDRHRNNGTETVGDPAAGIDGIGINEDLRDQKDDVPDEVRSVTFNLCTKDDMVCDFRGFWSILNYKRAIAIHGTYRGSPHLASIAAKMADRIRERLSGDGGSTHAGRIAFSSNRDGDFGIYTMDADGRRSPS